MKYKIPEYEAQLKASHPILQELCRWLDWWTWENLRKEITITCVSRSRAESVAIYKGQINPATGKNYEPHEVPASPHESVPCRAADIRSRDFTDDDCARIVEAINKQWTYDHKQPNRRCCVYHKVGNSVIHFHLQVHPNTVQGGKV